LTSAAWSTSSSTPRTATARAKLQPREYPPGKWTTPGHYNTAPRAVVRPYSEFAAILENRPLPTHKDGTRVWTALDRAENDQIVINQHPRHWAMFQRPNNELLPRGLQLVKEEEPPAGILLYAMTVYDETHANAFKTGEFGGGTGGGGNGGGGGGDDKKKGKKKPRSTPSRDTSHAARTETATPQGPPRPKRKAPEARAEEDASGPRGLQRPRQEPPMKGKQEKVGTTASAIIPGVAPTGSASRGEWDSALQAAISGPGSNFLRLQQLIGQIQSTLPADQPAHGLSVLDFLKLQGLVAEWVDPAPNQLDPQANHKLLELCGSVLLHAAIRMSLEAARLVTALINALLYGVSDVVGTIKTSMRGPRDRDRDDDDHRGLRETGRATGERDRPTGTEQRGHREDRRSDGSHQRDTENKGRRHTGDKVKKAVGSSAGLTLPTPPTTGTWPRVRLFLQITNVGWTLTLYVSPAIPKRS
jgi:hypothetical protein